jgi:hypothetical protein
MQSPLVRFFQACTFASLWLLPDQILKVLVLVVVD